MPFKSLGVVSYSPSIVTVTVSAVILEIFSVNVIISCKFIAKIQRYISIYNIAASLSSPQNQHAAGL